MLVAALIVAAGIGNYAASGAPVGDDARGKRLFAAYCATCHGATGKGDGPAAKTMVSGFGRRPRDLTDDAYLARKTDEQLTEVIKWSGEKGRHGSLLPMPQWALNLNDKEIADVVAYVRTLHRHNRITGNPVAGLKHYAQYCFACHGAAGKGNGPLAKAALGVKPRDFTNRAIMDKLSDKDIYNTIKLGGLAVGRSAWMPAWGDAFSEKELGDLVAYIRSLGAAPKPKGK